MPPAHPKNKHGGSIMIMVVIMLPIILMILSLSVDLGNTFLVRSQMQNAADAASLAAACRLRSGTTPTLITDAYNNAVKVANLNVFTEKATLILDEKPTPNYSDDGIVVEIYPGPPNGPKAYWNDKHYARVTITKKMDSFFAGMIGLFNITNIRQAVAGPLSSPACLITTGSILVTSQSQLTLPSCDIESGSIRTADKGSITADAINLTSGSPSGSNIIPKTANITGTTYDTKTIDTYPFFDIKPPSGLSTHSPTISNTYSPGKYSGKLEVSGVVNFKPGVYLIDGDMIIKEGSTVSIQPTPDSQDDQGVFFYSSSGVFNFNGKNSTINLSAPTTGQYAGLLIKQKSGGDAYLAGNLRGNLDFPNAFLHLDNQSVVKMNTGIIFAKSLTLENGTRVSMTNIYSSGSSTTSKHLCALYE